MSRKIKEIILSILSSRRKLTYLILIATLIIVIPVLATYTGPNRTVDEWQCHKEMVITGCYYTMPAEDEFHLNCKVASTYPGCPHPAADFFAGCDGNSQLHYIQEEQEFCKWVAVPAPPATVSGNVSCTNGTNGWCRSDALLNINGADPDPANSIIAIEGTRNGTGFACAGNTCQIDATGNGTYAFEYWAVSSYGDTSYKGNTTIKIDKDAPSVNLNVSGSMGHNNWYVSNVSWSTNLTDAQSGASHADVTVDGSAQANPGSYGVDGTHTIKATGYDVAGNTNQTQQSVQIDQTNPVPSYTLNGTLGTNGWYTSIVSWNATATDATSGVYAVGTQLDGASVNNSANIGTNGNHTLKVTAQDNAGNLNSTSGSFKIDQENPALTLNLSGTQGTHNWYTGPVSWSSTASDTISGLASHTATLNGSATTVNGFVNADGTYNLNLTTQDNAGNRSTQTQSFGIDQSTPTVSLNAISGTHSNTVQLSGNSADATSGVSYVEISIAGQTHQVSTTGGWTFNWNSNSACNGSVTASVRAVDQAGNSSARSSQTFTVQNTPTTLTLPAQTDASNPVVFNLNTSNLSQMVIRISDDAVKLPAVTQTFTGANIPTSYHWDRYMGDGSLAPKGTYTMNVKIFDKKTCTTDTASITLVVSESKFSAWVSGAPTNTPIPSQFTPTVPANLSEDQIGQIESDSFQTSPTPTFESTATQPAIVANTSAPSATEAPTNTPTPVVVAFLSPKAEQKTTTTTNDSPKAPTSASGATTDDTASTLPTGTLIGSAAAGLIGSIAAYQAAKEAERKRREEEARKRAEELMHQRNKLIKAGVDPYKMNTKQIAQLSALAANEGNHESLQIFNGMVEKGLDQNTPIQEALAIYAEEQKAQRELEKEIAAANNPDDSPNDSIIRSNTGNKNTTDDEDEETTLPYQNTNQGKANQIDALEQRDDIVIPEKPVAKTEIGGNSLKTSGKSNANKTKAKMDGYTKANTQSGINRVVRTVSGWIGTVFGNRNTVSNEGKVKGASETRNSSSGHLQSIVPPLNLEKPKVPNNESLKNPDIINLLKQDIANQRKKDYQIKKAISEEIKPFDDILDVLNVDISEYDKKLFDRLKDQNAYNNNYELGELFINKDDEFAIDPNDVKQGSCGDCYLLATLASLANGNPELIQKIITPLGNGDFQVKFYNSEIDSFVYVKVNKNEVLQKNGQTIKVDFGDENELWVAIVELGYAKFVRANNLSSQKDIIDFQFTQESKNNYDNICFGGYSHITLKEITGIDTVYKSASEVTFEEISEIIKNNNPVLISTLQNKGADPYGFYKTHTLIARHAMYILNINYETQMIEIGNPWGNEYYSREIPFNQLNESISGYSFYDPNIYTTQ